MGYPINLTKPLRLRATVIDGDEASNGGSDWAGAGIAVRFWRPIR